MIAKIHKAGKVKADPMRGLLDTEVAGKACVVEYEPDSDLRDTEQVPLLEEGGIDAFIRRKVLPYTPDAWINAGATKIGYEISFTRHFYKPQPLRTLAEIAADIVAAEKEAEGLLDGLAGVLEPPHHERDRGDGERAQEPLDGEDPQDERASHLFAAPHERRFGGWTRHQRPAADVRAAAKAPPRLA